MTGKGRRAADITIRLLGWEDVFGAVVTGDEVKKQKPEPEGVLSLARQLDVGARECAFVGDSPADIRAGQAAKMVTVAAAWHPVYRDEVRKLRPDLWAETPADVLKVL
jgi:phosphoglycolate phosphatase-like HAD superfamily hydrolase